MNKFRFIDHTGDVGVVVYGESLTQLFQNAAESFFSVLTDLEKIDVTERRRFTLEAADREELLVAWLNEFLYLFETQGLLFRRFDIKSINEQKMEVVVGGEFFSAQKHPIKRVIKAVTFHQLKIKETEEGWETMVIFDL